MLERFFLLAFILGVCCACGSTQSETPQDAGMKIRLERSGGFAGMTRNFEVDVETLSEEERRSVMRFVDVAAFFELPSLIPQDDPRGADMYNYRITVESPDGTHTVEANQAAMPESLQPLIDFLERRPAQP